MKREIVAIALAGILSGVCVLAANAVPSDPETSMEVQAPDTGVNSTPAAGAKGHWFEKARKKKEAAMAAILGLSDEQKSAIKQVFKTERSAAKPLKEKLAENRKQLDAMIAAVPFDETAARNLIAASEATRTELMLAHARTRAQVMALLTPDQRDKAKNLRLLTGGERRGGRF